MKFSVGEKILVVRDCSCCHGHAGIITEIMISTYSFKTYRVTLDDGRQRVSFREEDMVPLEKSQEEYFGEW